MTDGKTSRVRWFLVLWMFVLSVIAFLDRVNISIAGTSIADTYHLSNVQLGYIFSALLAGYAIFQAPGGRLADRFGPRRVLSLGVIWWGVFTAATALIPADIGRALIAFMIVRFLLGAGEAVVYPASNQFVSRWIPAQERGIANGLIFAGVGVGAGLSPPLITYLMINYGWRFSFYACAVLGLIAGAVWYIVARDTPAEHPGVSRAELEHIQAGLSTSGPSTPSQQRLVRWSTILRSKEVLAVTFSYFCFGYVAWIFFSWFFIYLARVRGLNLKSSAFYAMLPPLAMAIGSAVGGFMSDRITEWKSARWGRCVLASGVILVAAGFLAIGSRVESARLASVVFAGGAGALYLAQSSFWSVTSSIAGTSAGSVSGIMNMGAQIGGALTGSLTPWIADRFGWTTSFQFAACLCASGALAWLVVDPSRVLPLAGPTASQSPHDRSATF